MSSAKPCHWPYCLTNDEADELAQDIIDSSLGLPTPIRPDKRTECDCVDPGPIDWKFHNERFD